MILLEDLVKEKYHELNENELYIWQYILHHKKETQKMSIQELAQRCNVSHTSILRFAQKLGLDGFSELKVYLKLELSQKFSFDSREIDEVYYSFNSTMKMMMERDLTKILEMIHQAKRIFVYGTGIVQKNMARELRREFIYTNKVFHLVGSGDEIEVTLKNATYNDLFMIVSLSGDNETAVTLAKTLNTLNIPLIAIARDGNTLLSKYCEDMITFRYKEFRLGNQNAFFGGTGHFFLITDFLFLRYLEFLQEKENNLEGGDDLEN